MLRTVSSSLLLLFALLAGPRIAAQTAPPAQPETDPDSAIQVVILPNAPAGRIAPAVSLLAPTAYGRDSGHMAAGFGFESSTRTGSNPDGVAGMAVGFGDRRKLALEAGINILSVGIYEPFARRDSFNFKVHRTFSEDLSAAVGLRNTLIIGPGSDAPSEAYAVASKRLRLKPGASGTVGTLYATAGIGYLFAAQGNSSYRSTADYVAHKYGPLTGIASIAIRVAEQASVFTEWTGQDLDIGFSVIPFRSLGIVVTPALADLTGRAPGGPRFLLGVALPLSY